MTDRILKRQHPALRDDIGDLITRRPLPGPAIAQLDPFLFLNHHGPQVYPPDNRGLPFGPHPHRGFETVTFILAGELSHLDTGGHESVIHAGGVQWMTAGSGLVHAELSSADFRRKGGALEILQLWVNLPARLKMTQPRYVGLQRDAIPAIAGDGGRVTVNLIAGSYDGQKGPIEPLLDIFMATVSFTPGGRLRLPVAAGRSVFLYVVRGTLEVAGQPAKPHHLIELDEAGDTLALTTTSEAAILLGHAEPLNEPVVSYGPFVMNTRDEIVQAIQDYQAGKMGSLDV